MQYTAHYESPLGGLLLAADDVGLTGLWFDGEKYYALHLAREHEMRQTAVHEQTAAWLDVYFSGREPDFMPPAAFDLARRSSRRSGRCCGRSPMEKPQHTELWQRPLRRSGDWSEWSAQAVGGAVGHNEISILVPCHRVVGTGGSLTGYAGGVDKKKALLELEGVSMEGLFVPKRGTAL